MGSESVFCFGSSFEIGFVFFFTFCRFPIESGMCVHRIRIGQRISDWASFMKRICTRDERNGHVQVWWRRQTESANHTGRSVL